MRVGFAGAALRGPAHEDHRLALEQEPRPEREGPAPAPPVLDGQRVEVAVDRHDLAAPVSGDLLDHRAELGRGLDGTAALRSAPVAREHVGPVAVGHGLNARWRDARCSVSTRRSDLAANLPVR